MILARDLLVPILDEIGAVDENDRLQKNLVLIGCVAIILPFAFFR
jgi:hypothetical protein